MTAASSPSTAVLTRVLLVEDSPEDADFAWTALSQARPPEFDVRFARTSREAVAFLRGQTVDVILLDLALPDGRGLEVLEVVREAAGRAAIVVLTGSDETGLAEACLHAGAQDYLGKDDVDSWTLRRAIGYSVHRLQGELRRNVATVFTDFRTLSSRAEASSTISASTDGAAFSRHDPARDPVMVDAYAELLNRYVEATSLQGSRPRAEMEQIVKVIGRGYGGPRDLIDIHLAALERAASREPEARVRVLTSDGRLMALEMMGTLVEYYRNAYLGGDGPLR